MGDGLEIFVILSKSARTTSQLHEQLKALKAVEEGAQTETGEMVRCACACWGEWAGVLRVGMAGFWRESGKSGLGVRWWWW